VREKVPSVRVLPNTPPGSSFTNSATVSSATFERNQADNTGRATTTVIACGITRNGDIAGTPEPDVICGSEGRDRIAALGGYEIIFGSGGDDEIIGGDGDERVFGGAGNDSLGGGNGNDELYGGTDLDRLSAGPGDDLLNTVDGVADDASVGGEHVAGDVCQIDAGDVVTQCEAT